MLDAFLRAVPTNIAPAAPLSCQTVVKAKPVVAWWKRYNYLPPPQRVGRIMQVARASKRLSPAKLARMTGIAQTTLIALEQGVRMINGQEAAPLARALGLPLALLSTEEGIATYAS